MSSSGQHVGVIIVDTFCDADVNGVPCRFCGDVDVSADFETNVAHWECPDCLYPHEFPASNLWEIP